jgi:hypothetical protein
MPKRTSPKRKALDREVNPLREQSKERIKKNKWRAWHYQLGLRRLEIWAHPSDFAAIRDYARNKLMSRGIALDDADDGIGRESRENQS